MAEPYSLDDLVGPAPGRRKPTDAARIRSLPIDDRDPDAVDGTLVARWTAALRTPDGTRELWPVQALALDVIASQRGLVGSIGVGRGKTTVAVLAPVVLDVPAERTLGIVPAALVQAFEAEAERTRRHFRAAVVEVMSYELLSRRERGDLLAKLDPDLVILDEAHKLKARSTNRTQAFLSWYRARSRAGRPPTVIALSGTLMHRSVEDWSHLADVALGDGSPLPSAWTNLQALAATVDDRPAAPAASWQRRIVADIYGAASRAALFERVRTAPGVILTTTQGDAAACTLVVDPVRACQPERVRDAVRQLQTRWELPDGAEVDDPLSIWRLAGQLSVGFWYRNHWPDGPPDPDARRALLAAMRLHDVDDPADDPRIADEVARWRAACAAVAEPEREAVWLDRWLVDETIRRARGRRGVEPALIWTMWRAEAAALAAAGVEVVPPGTRPPDAPAGAPVGVSIRSHREGHNLQGWGRSWVLSPPSTASWWEQLLGRTHRSGQTRDEVWCHVWTDDSGPLSRALASATTGARAARQNLGAPQRLLDATWTDGRLQRDANGVTT